MKIKALAAVAVLASAGAAAGDGAAAPSPYGAQPIFDTASAAPASAGLLQETQFYWRSRQWCWYFDGWRGPGYYWCGYAFRRGYGWGGPIGWHGWNWHRAGPGGFRDDRPGFRGGPGGFRGGPGGFRGGGHEGGMGHAQHFGGGGHGGGGHEGGHHH